jgi:hypothetical protein
MPFDCTPIIDTPASSTSAGADLRNLSTAGAVATVRARPMPAWHIRRRPACATDTLAVLARARALLSDERRWSPVKSRRASRVAKPVGESRLIALIRQQRRGANGGVSFRANHLWASERA